tara:strand:- start:7679 stop:8212 length:534 start_codon:yes stop_codon:yes gene_type:complete
MDDSYFSQFINDPSQENFAELRNAHLQSGYDPYSSELEGIDQLLKEAKFEEVVARIKQVMTPNFLLSPSTHLRLAAAYEGTGDQEKCELERAIGRALIKGIQESGKGTPEEPYKVTRTSDEYDLLYFEGLKFESQSLREVDGRRMDVLKTKEGREIWFDVSDLLAAIKAKLTKKGPQ